MRQAIKIVIFGTRWVYVKWKDTPHILPKNVLKHVTFAVSDFIDVLYFYSL